ncbi:hypothetical protein SNEBB_004072 [Seison nebaliae]|nr:hypothetical protein SNEBB_004072 [Seison nebaliae]
MDNFDKTLIWFNETINNFISEKFDNNSTKFISQCSEEYIRLNYTGPLELSGSLSKEIAVNFRQQYHESDSIMINKLRDLLSIDHCIFKMEKKLEKMWLMIILFWNYHLSEKGTVEEKLKFIILYQNDLNEKSKSLMENSLSLCQQLDNDPNETTKLHYLFLKLQLALIYCRYDEAKDLLEKCNNELKFHIELDGALGRRTKYQQKDVAQLYIKLNRMNLEEGMENLESNFKNFSFGSQEEYLENLALNDDTVLEKINFANKCIGKDQPFEKIEEKLYSYWCWLIRKKSEAKDEIFNEESLTYLNFILLPMKDENGEKRFCWPIMFICLLERCWLESDSPRRLQRTFLQIENLLESLNNHKISITLKQNFFYYLSFPSIKRLKEDISNFYIKLGFYKMAIDLLENEDDWLCLCRCYRRLLRLDDAKQLINKELKYYGFDINSNMNEMKRSDNCLILGELLGEYGEIEESIDLLEKAFEVSNGRLVEPKYRIAQILYGKKEYGSAVEHLKIVTKYCPLKNEAFFLLGRTLYELEEYERASSAYYQCSSLEPDNFEIWNNLSICLIRIGKKREAHSVLKEAIKFKHDNWKLWENFMWISSDCGFLTDTIRAVENLLEHKDMKEKAYDPEDELRRKRYLDNTILQNIYCGLRDGMEKPKRNIDQLFLLKKTISLFKTINNRFPYNLQYSILLAKTSVELLKKKEHTKWVDDEVDDILLPNKIFMKKQKPFQNMKDLTEMIIYLKFMESEFGDFSSIPNQLSTSLRKLRISIQEYFDKDVIRWNDELKSLNEIFISK